MKILKQRILALLITAILVVVSGGFSVAQAAAVPGGTLDPTTVPKYVTPLVIPPVMPQVTTPIGTPGTENYDIAVRQFKQQILPGGIWNLAGGYAAGTYTYPPTTVWSYGSATDPMPDSSAQGGGVGVAPAGNSSFNYPAFTVENTSNVMNKVRWINELVKDPVTCFYGTTPNATACNYLPHLLPVDQTLHWANPGNADCLDMGGMTNPNRTDCETLNQLPYMGPVPIITHVHGAHVNPESDGYPEAWFLANADNIPGTYAAGGTRFNQWTNDGANSVAGSAFFAYENNQEATTLWYHDHSMGMTRLNVYAGPAGFWLIRGGTHGDSMIQDNTGAPGILPGPAPVATDATLPLNIVGDAKRNSIREIPVVFQDRSFDWVNAAGTPVAQGDPTAVGTKLWYPTSRVDFDGYNGPYLGDPAKSPADIAKIWNPEAFFNTIVANGVTWPKLNVATERYRFRLLNGCNSRTLNLAMKIVSSTDPLDVVGTEIPFFQIGGDQGFLPKVTMVETGFMSQLTPGAALPTVTPTVGDPQALLMMPAERADVIVDFSTLHAGTHVRIINTADDGPFSGFANAGVADPATTGQVMEFVVDTSVNKVGGDTSTPVTALSLPADTPLGAADNALNPRQLSLNEMVSDTTCIAVDGVTGEFYHFLYTDPTLGTSQAAFDACVAAGQAWGPAQVVPIGGTTGDVAGPRQALLGTVIPNPGGSGLIAVPERWADPITTNPLLGSTEIWEIYNTTADAHPIHVHLVRFEILDRQDLGIDPAGVMTPGTNTYAPMANELGFKDTVVAYAGQITRVKAHFDILGRYVWHCHIVEHEDNEMMLPFNVVPATVAAPGSISVPTASTTGSYTVSWTASATAGVSYVLQESADNFATAPTDIPVAGLSTVISGKGNNPFTFFYRVYAVYPSGGSSTAVTAANSITVTLPAAAPASITVPATSNNGSYTVSWAASPTPGATYTLEESTSVDFTTGVSVVGSNIAALSSPIAGKADGATYYYRVSATAPNYSISAPTTGANGCAVTLLTTTLTAPVTGASYPLGTAFPVTATATTPVGYVVGSVDFYDNGLLVGGTTTSPYTFSYTPVGAGSHNLTATVNYTNGATSTSPAVSVLITGITAPVFTTSAGTIDLGSSVILSATPAVVTGATVNLVMFMDGASPIGSVLVPTAPGSTYDYVWAPTTGGLKNLTAVVYYSNGQLATSAVVPLTVNTVVAAPGAPVVPASSNTGNYTVSWAASATVGATYILEESTDNFATDPLNISIVSDRTTPTSATIVGRTSGTYSYRVKAVNSPMVDSAWAVGGNSCVVLIPVTAVTFTVSPATSQTVGSVVTLTAVPTGGGAQIEYQLWTYDANGVAPAWRVAINWQQNPILSWDTSLASGAGLYNLRVHARTVGSTAPYDARSLNKTYSLTTATTITPVTAVTFTASPATSQTVGSVVTLTAVATGGGPQIEYQLWTYDANGVAPAWRVAINWQQNPILSWDTSLASGAGLYNLRVHARTVGSTAPYDARSLNKTYSLTTATTITPVTAVTFTASPATSQTVGSVVTLTAVATGGGPQIEYQLWTYDANGVAPAWRVAINWQQNPILSWDTSLASGAGLYNLRVHARTVGSTAPYDARSLNKTYSLN
ncbi:multicopper oxidase domain-containing protein [Geopsychrobacter electrodiphilus]|uniref:multicopper oxidase domain-containing protein n=1 Tax=Geopsychrobacter electrodiphilus TaxID=225196 RepID=UPI00036573EB|nr:multicopper oxidase domain-containing protein [Geopsychrobacter electrodiphilus]